MVSSLSKSVEEMSTADDEPPSQHDIVSTFQAIGHGISSSFLDKVRDVAKQFFALPEDDKQKYARAVNESEGYGSDRIVSDKQVLDWSHRLTLRTFPEDKRRFNLWPDNPNEFRYIIEEYASKIKVLTSILYKAMARTLNLEENGFLNQFGDRAIMQARFNFYPSCSRPDLVLGVKPHTDRSGMTILLQDKEVEVLNQIRLFYLTLNLVTFECMQIMSNGIFKSPMHRVVTNSEKLRISVALFDEPEPEKRLVLWMAWWMSIGLGYIEMSKIMVQSTMNAIRKG
ncbi:hypothetical protein REPUB_Repub03eG0105500 [Reevesia pubescens]